MIKNTTETREQYVIDIDKNCIPAIEHALTEFMTKVFDLAKESKCIGHGLEITKNDVITPNPLFYIAGRIVEHKNGTIGTIMSPLSHHKSTTCVTIRTENGDIWNKIPIEKLKIIGRE